MYKAIRIGGGDAVEFLQGQLTQDVARLGDTPSLPAAWCNPKGRVITTIRINLANNTEYDLVVPDSMMEGVTRRLLMYRLRADVEIEPIDSDWLSIITHTTDTTLQESGLLPGINENDTVEVNGLVAISLGDEEHVEIFGSVAAASAAGIDPSIGLTDEAWSAARVNAGLPDIDERNTEKYTPHMLNLDLTGAISFDKGCYTGQEVVARTEHLGKSKRRLMRYRGDTKSIVVGDAVADGERDVGSVVNVGDGALLAVTPVAIHDQQLTVGTTKIDPAP